MSSSPRSLAAVVAIALALGALMGAGAVLARGPATGTQPVLVATGTQPVVVAPGNIAPTGTTGFANSGTSTTGSAIAYPVFPSYPGTPGVAPNHTIVVTGFGQADLAADGSGRAEATKKALAAALADAKGQADLIATTLSIPITGVVSVSSSVGDYGPVPYGVPQMGGSTGPGQPVPGPAVAVALPQISVAVTVEYGIG